jgi:hypothetical protein
MRRLRLGAFACNAPLTAVPQQRYNHSVISNRIAAVVKERVSMEVSITGGIMRKTLWLGAIAVLSLALPALAQEEKPKQCPETLMTGAEFDEALVPKFYLEGNSIPTQKRNAAALKCGCGKRMVFALLDTSGYGTDVQQKYHGMAYLEKDVAIGDTVLSVGAYGIGLEKKEPAEGQPARVIFYDIAGQEVAQTQAAYDGALKQPAPLQVVLSEDQAASLCLGRYCMKIVEQR